MNRKRDASKQALSQRLSPEQHRVTQDAGTEPAFTGKYHDHKDSGKYVCVCCGTDLFASPQKYDSGTGWPSFYAPAEPESVATRQDASHGMVREEVLCAECNAHLGHVFKDGPEPTGLRYCINSASLDFEPEEQD